MPSTVGNVLKAADLQRAGVVAWGTKPASDEPGIYVVAMTADTDKVGRTLATCPIDMAAVENLLEVRPKLRVDGKRPEKNALAERVAAFWLPDETILYVGLAGSSIKDRVNAYYTTPLGARSPHAGGYFLKLLSNLDRLHVHYAECDDPDGAEDAALAAFVGAVSPATRRQLPDPAHPFPFANLVWPPGVNKAHGITGARKPRSAKGAQTKAVPAMPAPTPRRTQDVGAIEDFIQAELKRRGQTDATAVEAARWLDEAGLLKDSASRPGLPLRNLLRDGKIRGQRQEPNGRWFIDRI